jgi:hypothetical protein
VRVGSRARIPLSRLAVRVPLRSSRRARHELNVQLVLYSFNTSLCAQPTALWKAPSIYASFAERKSKNNQRVRTKAEPFDELRLWLALRLRLRKHLAKHRVEDSAVAVVLHFDGRIDSAERLELNGAAIVAMRRNLDVLTGLYILGNAYIECL